jgi:hypothetical protein
MQLLVASLAILVLLQASAATLVAVGALVVRCLR